MIIHIKNHFSSIINFFYFYIKIERRQQEGNRGVLCEIAVSKG